ncbi:dihydrofolate reductase [Apiospora arundinis]
MSTGTATNTMLPIELTLVVAATRDMGIGRAGTLPWTGLRKEMAYFARVTKRLPLDVSDPLKGRLNIVISRSHPDDGGATEVDLEKEPVKVNSLAQALEYLKRTRPAAGTTATPTKAFVIGGAQIYGASLALPEAKRVLLTSVMDDFECDTFFPLRLLSGEDGGDKKWAQRSKEELDAWTGETVPEGLQEENGTRYEFQMWERVD